MSPSAIKSIFKNLSSLSSKWQNSAQWSSQCLTTHTKTKLITPEKESSKKRIKKNLKNKREKYY